MTHIQKKHADALKKAFSKEVMSKVPSQSKYLDWLKKDHIVNIMTPGFEFLLGFLLAVVLRLFHLLHPWLTQQVLVLPFQLDLASDIFRQVSYS